MDILIVLLVLLIATRTFGELANRLGQPGLLGELLAGVALGAILGHVESVPYLSHLTEDQTFSALSNLGMFFLMLYGGVELRASDLARGSTRSFIVAASGLIFPVVVGFAVAWLFLPPSQFKFAQCLFVGTALAITAVPASIRVLIDLGKLESPAGRVIVAAAIIDDVLSLLLLAFLTGIVSSGRLPGWSSIAWLCVSIILFFAIAMLLERLIVPRMGRFVSSLKTPEFEFSSLLIAALALAVLAELLGLHFILGAFMAGLLFERRYARKTVYREVKKRVSAVTLGFLAPIFFASIGMHLDISAVTTIPLFLVVLIVVAFLTKLVGAGLPAYALGLSRRDAVAVGVGMSARGAVELVVADIALQAGLFTQPTPVPPIVADLFSAVVIIALVTTLVTPLALKRAFGAD